MTNEAPESEADQRALFFGISAARLRSRATWGGIVLVLSALVPYDVVGDRPLFVWDLLAELAPSAAVAALALPLAGVAVLLGRVLTRRAASLAAVVLGALASVALLRQLGAERAAWDATALPETLSARSAGALLALALIAAAGNLAFRDATRRWSRGLVVAAIASAAYYYAWPRQGMSPFGVVWMALRALPDLPAAPFVIGALLLVFLSLWPLFVTLAGLSLLRWSPTKDEPWISVLANWSFSAWLLMLAYRALALAQVGVGLYAYLGVVLVVTALVPLASAAIAALAEAFVVPDGDLAPTRRALEAEGLGDDPFGSGVAARPPAAPRPGLSPKVASALALGVFLVLGGAQLVLARPPKKATGWELGPGSPEADRVFGDLLLRWQVARAHWASAVVKQPSAEARLEVKASGKELTEASGGLDPGLGGAIAQLVEGADDLDLAGRRWTRLVADVNRASQAAKLPYYVDASVQEWRGDDGLRRHFFVHPFRIHAARRWDVDGEPFGTLHVRSVQARRAGHFGLVGFSRDADPFALVVLDETDQAAEELADLVETGGCGRETIVEPEVVRGSEACDALVASIGKGRGAEVRAAVLAGTERHELQHQIDGPHLAMAEVVHSRLAGYAPDYQDRVNREASAFLAQMTAEGLAPRVTLVSLARYLFSSDEGTYPRTATLVFEALSGEPILRGLRLDGERFWAAFAKVAEKSDDELRARARATWRELYGDELADPRPL